MLLKRDDFYHVGEVNGGKARACWALSKGALGLVTACSRSSPQSAIVAEVARHRGIPAHIHCATGDVTPELLQAQRLGAGLIRHFPGHRTVIESRARADARALGYAYVPFGMAGTDMVTLTARQAVNVPDIAERIVVPVGSGQSLAGVIRGIHRGIILTEGRDGYVEMRKRSTRPRIVGIVVGADPVRNLDTLVPGWREMAELQRSALAYDEPAPVKMLLDVELDPYYEAKCLPVLRAGDLLWVVGKRTSA